MSGHVVELRTAGEIGVILLLFLAGLDTQPKRLLSMRRLFFGLGTAQHVLTTAAIAGLLIAFSRAPWQAALVIALGLAISSEAVAISSLEEHAESARPLGSAVMAVQIYQDFITAPMLAVAPCPLPENGLPPQVQLRPRG